MRTLSVDLETFSSVDLIKSGVHRYTESPDFTILLFAYAFDDGPVHCIDTTFGLFEGRLPKDIVTALTDPQIKKTAFNANFERVCLSRWLGIQLLLDQWECTMAHSLMAGLPGSLDSAAKALGLEEQKAAGTQLISYFSKPCKPTAVNGMRTRNLPEHAPEKWAEFTAYCKQDVEVERAVRKKLSFYSVPAFEKTLWNLDQKINDQGILVDTFMVDHAIACNEHSSERLTTDAKELTGLDNPNSTPQLKKWIEKKTGIPVPSLNKADIEDLYKSTADPDVKEALHLRVQLAKTSTAKYKTLHRAVCSDGRIRGTLQYYGASRSGRWGGRLIQPQNLPQNHIPDLDLARETLLSGDYEWLDVLFGNTPDTLSQLVRTALMPSSDRRFIVTDFSAIEARVIAWLAGEHWRLDVFNTHGKIYEASAAQMFRVPIESVTKGSDLRQRGKVAELALGYQGGPGALINMGALKKGLTEEELPALVDAWRASNPSIVSLWKKIELAAKKAIEEKTSVTVRKFVRFTYDRGNLYITLPSGRVLSYINAGLKQGGRFDNEVIAYMGVNQTTRKWEVSETYGGKLTENIIQAIARDCLAEAMLAVDAAGYEIVLHVHDEIVIDAPYRDGDIDEINAIMGRTPAWAEGLPLTADSYECSYYRKD